MAQAASWTQLAAGRWDRGIMTALDYGAYPIQDFVATGRRIAEMPLTPERVLAALRA